jgi:hypothetical protein
MKINDLKKLAELKNISTNKIKNGITNPKNKQELINDILNLK